MNSNNTIMSCAFLPVELIVEVLSYLPVKSLIRWKKVCKLWNTLISDPTFVELHLQRSTRRNRHIAGVKYGPGCIVVTFPMNHLLENPSIKIANNPYYRYQLNGNDCFRVVGSCNGLLCLVSHSSLFRPRNIWFHILNPATRKMSKIIGSFHQPYEYRVPSKLKFAFGYDNSTKTYKVVVLSSREVHVFSLGDNIWRKISSLTPFDHVVTRDLASVNKGVYLSGTVNWFAIRNKLSYDNYPNDITVEQFVIISLDLGTETYKQLLLPRGVDEVPYVEPTIAVLMDCLCFSHHLKRTHFIIWQMMEFGVEQSWTQFLRISFQNLHVDARYSDWSNYQFMFPLCLSKNGDTLILAGSPRIDRAILYNLRDNRAERASKSVWCFCEDYAESLVSIR